MGLVNGEKRFPMREGRQSGNIFIYSPHQSNYTGAEYALCALR